MSEVPLYPAPPGLLSPEEEAHLEYHERQWMHPIMRCIRCIHFMDTTTPECHRTGGFCRVLYARDRASLSMQDLAHIKKTAPPITLQ